MVVHIHVPPLSGSMICYWLKGADALQPEMADALWHSFFCHHKTTLTYLLTYLFTARKLGSGPAPIAHTTKQNGFTAFSFQLKQWATQWLKRKIVGGGIRRSLASHYTLTIELLPRVEPGHSSSPLSIYFLIFSPFYFSLSFIGFTYFLLLSIPSLSTRIVPLRFQAGGRRRRPYLGLVCVLLCNLCYLYSLVKMDCGVLFYLV